MAKQQFTAEELATEEWRRSPFGIPGLYSVSSLGRVRRETNLIFNRAHRTQKVLRLAIGTNSRKRRYSTIALYVWRKPRKTTRFHVHRLVALAFLGPRPFVGAEINHKDTDKTNNRATNLEYCTRRQNIDHAMRFGLCPSGKNNGSARHPESRKRGVQAWCAKLNDSDIRTIRIRRSHGETYKAIATDYNVSIGLIGKIVRRVVWAHVE
jgi:hypothetical protein